MPKVSVLMSVYNPSNYDMLKTSVNSILNQDFSDFEFIIYDDGSSQEVKKWLKNISLWDKRIKLNLTIKNNGLAYALNQSLAIASGEYIARQDVDDYSMQNRFSLQCKCLDENPQYTLVGSNIAYFDNQGVYNYFFYPEMPIKKDFLFVSPFSHGSIMIRKNALMHVNGYRVQKKTRRCEDYDLFMRLYYAGYLGYNIQQFLYFFREDQETKARRKMKYRIDEMRVRLEQFKLLGFGPIRYVYAVKPVVIGIIPKNFLDRLKSFYYKQS